jgi:hypothetical protein
MYYHEKESNQTLKMMPTGDDVLILLDERGLLAYYECSYDHMSISEFFAWVNELRRVARLDPIELSTKGKEYYKKMFMYRMIFNPDMRDDYDNLTHEERTGEYYDSIIAYLQAIRPDLTGRTIDELLDETVRPAEPVY